MSGADPGTLARFFAPQWAGGWAVARWTWVAVALVTTGRIALGIGDAYGSPDMVFTRGVWRLAEHMVFTEPMAWACWVVAMVGIVLVAFRRSGMMQLGLVLWIIATEILHFHEALNVKRYDVLFLWFAIALLFSPAGQADLHRKWRSPFSRYFLTIVFCAIYGSTGILKLIYEPGWWTGAPLDHFLLHPLFGQKPVGLMLSGSFLTAPMGWWTLAFEVLFPFLIWFRRTNLLLLVLGVGFHLGLLFLMDVGAFSFVAMAAYPALLHPEVGRDLHARFAAWRGRSASPAGPM